jgi:hypothetical protein
MAAPKPIVGTVTRGNNGSTPYIARFANGTTVNGAFVTARDAQIPIEAAFGGRFLRWTRADLPGGVETYTAQVP